MVVKDREVCGVTFESEGHPNGYWLTECEYCNKEAGRGKVL